MPFHYDPSHNDHTLDAFFARATSDTVAIVPATEGETFHVEKANT
jgi:hypothetical protein